MGSPVRPGSRCATLTGSREVVNEMKFKKLRAGCPAYGSEGTQSRREAEGAIVLRMRPYERRGKSIGGEGRLSTGSI